MTQMTQIKKIDWSDPRHLRNPRLTVMASGSVATHQMLSIIVITFFHGRCLPS